jgi:hypothetical protein
MSETPFQESQRVIRELRDENARLRAALTEIQDHGGVDGPQTTITLNAVGHLECRRIARRALGEKT